jgi:hypothetical protein
MAFGHRLVGEQGLLVLVIFKAYKTAGEFSLLCSWHLTLGT